MARRPGPTTRRTVHEVVGDEVHQRPDTVVTEEPLEIRLTWPGVSAHRVAVTMRTPGADFELAAGYLQSEGVTTPGTPPRTVAYCTDVDLTPEQEFNVVTVELGEQPRRHPASRSTTMSSACGVCGTESIDEIFTPEDDPIPVRTRRRRRRGARAAGPADRAAEGLLPDRVAARGRGLRPRRSAGDRP